MDNRRFRGEGLATLVRRFRTAMAVSAECLLRNRINSPFFDRAPEEVRTQLSFLTKVDLNCCGDGRPIEPMKVLRDADFRRVHGEIVQELGKLIGLLEQHPHSVLHRSLDEEGNKKSRSGKPNKKEFEIWVRDHLIKHASSDHSLTRDEVAKELGIATGSVSNTSAWKTYHEELVRIKGRKSKPRGRKTTLDLAAEQVATEEHKQKQREALESLDPETSELIEGRTPEQREELAILIDSQKKDARSEKSRSRRSSN